MKLEWSSDKPNHHLRLNGREQWILTYLAAGLTFKEAAPKLDMESSTAKNYAARAYRKLGCHNLQGAISEAIFHGYIREATVRRIRDDV